jgi:hypothetical protein
MKLETVRTVRNMALITQLFGFFTKIPVAFWVGTAVWMWTFLWTVRELEDKFLQEPKNEEKDDEDQGS